MFPVHYRSIFATLMLPILGLGCASAALDTPKNGAANPQAHTMPVSQRTQVLSKDFDPWAEGAGAPDDAHAHHHGGHSEESEADPTPDPTPSPAPNANSIDDADAAPHEGHDHE